MIIREIVPITKQKSRVVTDEEISFILYRGELSRYGLEAGRELPPAIFQEIYSEILVKRAKLRAMHLLSRTDYTEAGLRRKLDQGGYTAGAVEEAVAYVKRWHYLDDVRYARNYLEAVRGRESRRKAEAKLMEKGVSRQILKELAEENGQEPETEMILQLLRKKCARPEAADDAEKRRLYGWLARRGFRNEDIFGAFRSYFEK